MMFASRGEGLRQQVMTRRKNMTQALDIQALLAQLGEALGAVPTNVGQTTPAPATNVAVTCNRCLDPSGSARHSRTAQSGCSEFGKPTNVGQTTAQATFVAPADVLQRRTFTLTKVKVGKNTEKWQFKNAEGKTWIDLTLPLGSGLGDVLNLAIS